MKTIILINGLPRAGKDTVADFLVNNFNFTKMSFAETMKVILAKTFGISVEYLEVLKNDTVNNTLFLNEKPFINFRQILQNFGNEGIKPVFGESVWADLLYKKVKEHPNDFIVVPDFRFLVEYKPSDEYNIITVLIKDKRKLPLSGHASDVELYQHNFKFDYTIINDGTLDELYQKVTKFMTIPNSF